MANNDEYRDYDDAYSAKSENTNTSVKDAKRNRILLDNNMNWYVFENSILMGLDYLDKYRNTIFRMATKVRIGSDYYMRPEYVSYELYGTTDYWYILLWLNDMKNPNEFVKSEIYVIAKNKIGNLQKVLDQARNYVYNVYNPKPVQKHYIKHPKLPSINLLPDSYNEKIYDCGFVTYEKFNFLNNLEYIHNPNEYYHGKSKMTETKENIFVKSYKELSLRYMDGIQISNTTYDPIFDNSGEIKEYKFTGYMYFPYAGIYDFQFNGINGSAYLMVGNEYCKRDGETNIKLPEVDKKFDFFELKTKNSDFKKRNWDGWTYPNKNNNKIRLVIDPIKRKPVAKAVITNDFFNDVNIITKRDKNHVSDNIKEKCKCDIGNCNCDDDETIFISYKDEDRNSSTADKLFYNILTANDLNIDLEPYNNGNDGKIIFSCELMANNVNNVEIQPYIKINYTDNTTEESRLNHYNIGNLWDTNEYETLLVSVNKDKDKKVSTVEFGIICEKRNKDEDCSAEIKINEVSINLTEFDTVTIEIGEEQKNRWIPFTCSYKYNGNILKMFYVKRRVRIKIDNNRFMIHKGNDPSSENNIIILKNNNTKLVYRIETDGNGNGYIFRRNWLKINNDDEEDSTEILIKNKDSVKESEDYFIISLKSQPLDENDIFYLISPYEYINRDQIAIVPLIGENYFNESVLVTISSEYDREACFLQHNINKEVIINNDEETSTVSFKTCLFIENNNAMYKFQLEEPEDVEIFMDNDQQPIFSGTGRVFPFSPVHTVAHENEIKSKGYRLGNLKIYIKNTKKKKIKATLYVEEKRERNIFKELTDDFFVVKPQQLFTYSNILNKYIGFGSKSKYDNDNFIEDSVFVNEGFIITKGDNCLLNINENYINEDLITIRDIDGDIRKQLSVFKPGIITLEEKEITRECTNYVLEFDIRINSDQNGLFIINLDRQTNGNKYSLIFNYKTQYNENPIFNLSNGLYTNTLEDLKDLSNIDIGIDFYKHKYEEIPIYKDMVDITKDYYYNFKKFEILKNRTYHIKLKKKKNFLSLQIDGKYIAIWHDYDKVYVDGLCGFTFVNLNHAYIDNLSLKC